MAVFPLRAIAQYALIGLATAAVINRDVTTPSTFDGLVPREFKLPDGNKATVYENPNLVYSREPSPSPADSSSDLNKRLTYITTPLTGWSFCWDESSATKTFGPTTPLAADCYAISAAFPEGTTGHWSITLADFETSPTGFVTLAASGTCVFKVALSPWTSHDITNAAFGNGDLRYYINNNARDAVAGRIQATDYTSFFKSNPLVAL
ncbi:hypothetical protein B0H63DRAFT_470910 [Podospora didyma]|uniref:Ecp2 effector protein-like domain-containing protein n=1 Tax=Podospora didyma TaxID=330526 RepID=A0AAE0NUB8_9PEZI|nr:hypothetical protein B0H63DRAFT_470910 [Podospora didyma]